MRHRQRLIQQQRAPQHPERWDQERGGHRSHRANGCQQAKVQDVGKRRTHQPQPEQRQPHVLAAPACRRMNDGAVGKQRQQEQGRAEHAAQGREPTVEPAALIQPAAREKPGKAVASGGQ